MTRHEAEERAYEAAEAAAQAAYEARRAILHAALPGVAAAGNAAIAARGPMPFGTYLRAFPIEAFRASSRDLHYRAGARWYAATLDQVHALAGRIGCPCPCFMCQHDAPTTPATGDHGPLCAHCRQVIVAEAGDTCASIPPWRRWRVEYCAPPRALSI